MTAPLRTPRQGGRTADRGQPPTPLRPRAVPPDAPAPQLDESFRATWRFDLPAGMVVFFVALPLCLGIALASNAPLLSGLITGIVGGLVVSRLSGSQLMVSGPAAGLTAIVITAIAQLGTFDRFLVAVVLAGALQLLLGVLRAGIIGYFFPSAVIKGMLAAIGLILILKQLPYALGAGIAPQGMDDTDPASSGGTFGPIVDALTGMHPVAVALSLSALVVLYLLAVCVFYAMFPDSQGPRQRLQVTFAIAWMQFHALHSILFAIAPRWPVTSPAPLTQPAPLALA